ncbi:hypothetical protein [Geotalea uraniireducens]|uniref:hypothetical protein n=1 Tax=Geotalea uraniireducens TaxID=351604 RepID=UPI00059BB85D|nr:hypothetical protein [Geotalea uraniireducens]
MAKEYTITLHEPPTNQVIREGMVQHLNQMAQDGWRMVNVIKESGYFYFSAALSGLVCASRLLSPIRGV